MLLIFKMKLRFKRKNMKWTRLIFGRSINCGAVIYKGNLLKG